MRKELGYIHIAVLLFGLTGLFAKVISLHAIHIVLGRVFFATVFLLFVIILSKKKFSIREKKNYFYFLLMGAILAIHWSSFFYAIQLSTVAIGLITFALFPIFASLLEPVFFKEELHIKMIIPAFIAFIGIFFVVPELDFQSEFTIGAVWGMVSALTFAILSMLNRKFAMEYSSLIVGFYQNLFAFFWLIPSLFLYTITITLKDVSLLFLLGVVFTGFTHVLYIRGLEKVNVRKASIITSLEPVYGILAAALLLFEFPEMRQWIGIVLIFAVAVYTSFSKGSK